ncbi:MAG: diguanylate cyclase [Anaerolineales bacterium]|nr:diguanylate cyclase [Anaerolineales bacterium]
MDLLDMRTVIFSDLASSSICVMVIAIQYAQNRDRYAGLGYWLIGFVLQFVALLFLTLEGAVHDFWSIIVGNTLVIAGVILIYVGLEAFVGKRSPQIYNIFLLFVFALVHTYFTLVRPNLEARVINFSLGVLIVCAQCAWLMLRRVEADMRPLTRSVGWVFAGYCLFSVVRIALSLAAPAGEGLMQSNTYHTSVVMVYQMLAIILAFSLFLNVNRRLVVELEREFIEHRQSEEKFHKAFHSSPDAILISRLDDGRLIEVNEGFCRITGYSREEALSRSSIDLGLWANPPDREQVIAALREKQRLREQVHVFRAKSGEIVNGLFSGEIILLGGEAHVLSVVRDIGEQKRAQEALRQSEQKFRGVIEQSWDGITVTDEQGLITEWNHAMERILGLKAGQVLGKPIWDIQSRLGVEEHRTPERRQQIETVTRELLKSGQAPWLGQLVDTELSHPDGSRRFVQSAVFPIKTEHGFMLCSVIRDITERKRSEELIRLRLRLWEYAATHPLEELMQKALDEIGALTGSLIGFYHFVEEDQNTLLLQAWSTRTLTEFCRAEGKGLHYDIDEAGVWVDAFHAQKAVIHNDYATLAHRKGMPEGHADVVRELVVPVMRDGRVVSILGVGNKSSDYDENDIELVSYIADIIWTIVERKKAEEYIRQLNSRLEFLAMTDELTGVLNRRSFFKRGEEEFGRFLRYQAPFSLLILDIDDFKNVNDTYGHDAGDRALKCFVKTLQRNIRNIDILARLGGEEFGILLPNTGAANASVAAEKLRMAVEMSGCSINGGQMVNVTVSIGLDASSSGAESFEAILKNADTALYQAKNQGRNAVVQYTPPSTLRA